MPLPTDWKEIGKKNIGFVLVLIVACAIFYLAKSFWAEPDREIPSPQKKQKDFVPIPELSKQRFTCSLCNTVMEFLPTQSPVVCPNKECKAMWCSLCQRFYAADDSKHEHRFCHICKSWQSIKNGCRCKEPPEQTSQLKTFDRSRFVLKGISIVGDDKRAYFFDKKENQTKEVFLGDFLEGYQLEIVEKQRVHFRDVAGWSYVFPQPEK